MSNIICARCGTEIGDYQYPTKKDHYERTMHGDYAHCINGLKVELQRYKNALEIAEEALPSLDRLAVEEARAAMGPKGKINPTTKQRDLLRKLRAAIQGDA